MTGFLGGLLTEADVRRIVREELASRQIKMLGDPLDDERDVFRGVGEVSDRAGEASRQLHGISETRLQINDGLRYVREQTVLIDRRLAGIQQHLANALQHGVTDGHSVGVDVDHGELPQVFHSSSSLAGCGDPSVGVHASSLPPDGVCRPAPSSQHGPGAGHSLSGGGR